MRNIMNQTNKQKQKNKHAKNISNTNTHINTHVNTTHSITRTTIQKHTYCNNNTKEKQTQSLYIIQQKKNMYVL